MPEKIGFIGCGNMGQALLGGWLKSGAVHPSDVWIHARTTAQATAQKFGVAHCGLPELLERSQFLVLGVKPQQLSAVISGLEFRPDHCVVSLLAGVELEALEALVSPAMVVRTMPNLACGALSGVTLFQASPSAASVSDRVEALFAALGHVETFEDEALFHAGTGVSGSGPAYLFLAAAGLAAGGAEAGLAPAVALRLACETVVGAGAMLTNGSECDPDALRTAVTSPGGTTQAALGVLEQYDFKRGIMAAVNAAADRSKALSRGE